MKHTEPTTHPINDHEPTAEELAGQIEKTTTDRKPAVISEGAASTVMGIPTETLVFWLIEPAPIYVGAFLLLLRKGCE